MHASHPPHAQDLQHPGHPRDTKPSVYAACLPARRCAGRHERVPAAVVHEAADLLKYSYAVYSLQPSIERPPSLLDIICCAAQPDAQEVRGSVRAGGVCMTGARLQQRLLQWHGLGSSWQPNPNFRADARPQSVS